MTDDLVAFLRARYAETAAKAEAAQEGGEGRWHQDDAERHPGRMEDERGEPVVYDEGSPSEAQAAHIVEHDPARVLAEVDAKRRLLDWLERKDDWALDNNLWTWDSDEALCLLALPYADHPNYREEWRP